MNDNFIKANRGMIAVAAVAVVVGTGAGYWLTRGPAAAPGKPDQPIEWNTVQAVPSRAPDADDQDWQNRVDALDNAAGPAAESPKNGASGDTAPLENANQ